MSESNSVVEGDQPQNSKKQKRKSKRQHKKALLKARIAKRIKLHNLDIEKGRKSPPMPDAIPHAEKMERAAKRQTKSSVSSSLGNFSSTRPTPVDRAAGWGFGRKK